MAVKTFSYLAALLTLCGSVAAATDHDVIIADFEGDDYGDWVVTGEAFGTGPAHGPRDYFFEIQAQIEPGKTEEVGLKIRGVDVVYNVKRKEVHCLGETAPLKMTDGSIKVHLLADRTSLELFGNDGLLSMSSSMLPDDDNKSLAIFSRAGQTKYCELRFWEFKSIWNN